MSWLDRVLAIVKDQELSLLPRRKRRALDELTIILRSYDRDIHQTPDLESGLRNLLKILDREDDRRSFDWDGIAETWLDLIRPAWYERLIKGKRTRPLLLKDIRKDLMGAKRIPLKTILEHFEKLPTLPPIDERVAACILGLPE